MKHNALQNVIQFIFKYIWIICCLLILIEIISTTYTSAILVKETSEGVMRSTSGEISGRIDGVLRLITGLTKDPRFNDTSKPVFDRIIQARPYQESYNLFMVAMTDENANVISADETEPPAENTSLAHRDYMKELFATGKYQITDAFPAGSDGVTLNYTIAAPIMKDNKAAGSIFGSIYFEDLVKIIQRNQKDTGSRFFLFGEDSTVMYGGGIDDYGDSLKDALSDLHLIGTSVKEISSDFAAGKSGSHWAWGKEGLSYASYQLVSPTNWKIVYQVPLTSVVVSLLPGLITKVIFYILICLAIAVLGKRYINKQLASVNHPLDKVTSMQRELFQSEQTDYEGLLELTQKGLTDQLTDLSTRAVLFQKLGALLEETHNEGALLFIDLDDLKLINDQYGHEAGDCALIYFAKTLKQYELQYDGIASRYGGDEFVLVLDNVSPKEALEISETLCRNLNTDLQVKDHHFEIHGCIGFCCYPLYGNQPEELISKADLALYSAKQNGKNCCIEYGDIAN